MMDPQMDWGMHFAPHGNFDPGAPLSPAQLCWIMDEMAAREVAWLRGGTLAQTVFTSLHYHNPTDIQPTVHPADQTYMAAYVACAAMRTYLLAYAKGIELAWNALCDANAAARDGEDIWVDPYGVPLEMSESVPDVLAYVDGVVRWLAQYEGFGDVVARLRFRVRWIAALQLQLREGHEEICALPPAPVPWAFDNVTGFLRQNMPLPALRFPTHEETWATLHGAIAQLASAPSLALMPLATAETFLANLPEMLSVVRAQYRAVLNDLDRDALVDEWLASATNAPPGVLDRLDREITAMNDRRSFVLWRDIVAGVSSPTIVSASETHQANARTSSWASLSAYRIRRAAGARCSTSRARGVTRRPRPRVWPRAGMRRSRRSSLLSAPAPSTATLLPRSRHSPCASWRATSAARSGGGSCGSLPRV